MSGGYGAYKRAAHNVETGRSVEFRLLGQVTAALVDASKTPRDLPRRIDALLWNKRVWDHFMIDLSGDENALPAELRKALIGIGVWVNAEVKRAMDGKVDLSGLIEVNEIVMKGLRGDGGAGQAPAPAPAPAPAAAPGGPGLSGKPITA